MSIRVALRHTTCYRYDRLVGLSPQIIRLRPAPHCRTPVRGYSLNIQPTEHYLNWQQDPFGNFLARMVLPAKRKVRQLSVDVDLVVDMPRINPFDFFVEESAEKYPFCYEPSLKKELTPFLEIKEQGPLLAQWVESVDRTPRRTVDFLVELNSKLAQDIEYLIRMEPGIQPCELTLSKGSGSCRDSGWLLVQILRQLGLAARFASGYLVQLAPDTKSLDGPSGVMQDVLDLHAWAEVYVPGAGWIGLDPTSGLIAGEGHLPLACSPDPQSSAPITGGHDEAEVEFEFHMEVTRIHEDPRVTKPFTTKQWEEIDRLGDQIDGELAAADVRLTMGGEPTFVSIDDMDSPQWTTAALGPHKRERAGELVRRLRDEFAPGALLHFAQGKWYPGEELPRWALNCYWRNDQTPVWRRPELVADDRSPGDHDIEDAKRFATHLAERLGVSPRSLMAGYEDPLYYLWKERTLPVNIDPLEVDLDDPSERKRLAALLARGMRTITGFALPLRWQQVPGPGHWTTGQWVFRSPRMLLVPGDSPMGYRLPLDSLKYDPQAETSPTPEFDPLQAVDPLGDIHGGVAHRYAQFRVPEPEPHGLQEQVADEAAELDPAGPSQIIRTALCVEPRQGHIHVFLPPMTHLEHFLDLVACIEDTAAALDLPIIVEGYSPPPDSRLKHLGVTPDPGVIEVNLPPAADWKELSYLVETLYEQARLTRLGTEKFMLDGRHTGTGGGNHVTLGGPTPSDSPLLRRPALLRGLITYWQHHPSLSYLFAGLFVGPTSQAPRVDEARHEGLYELEIAFQQLDGLQGIQPWAVDRALRHLLIDVTGNTHRAEFCIDKMFSPEGASGRLGLLEMRSLEMPPHARMSLLQQLLLRAIVARLWNSPYRQPLVRWGTRLHDQFMLPYFLWYDLKDVLADLHNHGYTFQPEWFAPNFEFRLPVYGRVQIDHIELELRMAVEPWHVLGEEAVSGGTARYVDSSVERLQVKVAGMTDTRHVLACGRRRVPLTSTGVAGEYVAGIRYRAWQPPSALHPMIPIHTPLVLDLVDIWNERSVGGCTYHVFHPGGRNPTDFPVNSYEAEGRRQARFWPYGHTPGRIHPPPEERNRDYPYTLDLRRAAQR